MLVRCLVLQADEAASFPGRWFRQSNIPVKTGETGLVRLNPSFAGADFLSNSVLYIRSLVDWRNYRNTLTAIQSMRA